MWNLNLLKTQYDVKIASSMFIDNGDMKEGITLLCLYFEKIKSPQFDLSFELRFIYKINSIFSMGHKSFQFAQYFFTKY